MADRPRDERPDPDALLQRIADEDARAARGRLKIFFGASPGVGKTYAMLAEARRLHGQGADVVVGVVETHGRLETTRLVEGLDVLPRLRVDYRGRTLEEFDLDAALARKPAILLVDELAHANAPGTRHPKRYQDVNELLAAGIDVYTTLNVQHIESLNDVVGGITGIKIRETLPDKIFDRADEVVLVDLTPDDLLQRLKEGKVYLSEQAERAVQNFFRKGNLLALRELALRRTADRVDTQMRTYRRDKVGGRVWKARDSVLVGVGPTLGNEIVVRVAAQLAAALDAQWHAVYVETPALQRLSEARRRRILSTLKLAQELGAQTSTLSASDPVAALVDYARNHNLGKLVVGRGSRKRTFLARWRRSAPDRIGELAPDLDVLVVNREASPTVSEQRESRGFAMPEPRGMVGAVGISVVTTLLAVPLSHHLELANIVMLFLLAVVVTAMLFGRGPAVLSAIVNVLAFDFFFVPPHLSFAVSDAQYLVTFAVMLATGLVVGQLTARLRYQARVASHREDRMRHLFELARELSAALATEQVVEIGERFVVAAARCKVAVIVLNDDDTLALAPQPGPDAPATDAAIARWVVDRGEPAGIATDTLPSAPSLYLPLKAPVRTRGVLIVEPTNARLLMIPEQRRLLETCAALIAIALERVHFVTVAQNTLIDMESERLRNSVLAALSHDLRTPLTSLVGLADTLSHDLINDPAGAQAAVIRDQARRTAKLVNQLLEMARLEARRTELHKDWQSLEELVGAALTELDAQLADRNVETAIPPDLPLVHCDGVLITRVLVNLLENAVKYTPPGSPVRIATGVSGPFLEVSIEDRGPGLPVGKEQAIFEKFMRGQSESVIPGVGLGLAICRAIITAHGGEIRGENRMGGGARFVFMLPAGTPPEVEPEAEQNVTAEM